MASKLSDIMTPNPTTVRTSSTLVEAADAMRQQDIGDVLVVGDDGGLRGIVTDRDIVVRAIAEGRDPSSTRVEEVCSGDVTTCSPDSDVDEAVQLMRDNAIRRLPVVDGKRLVGVVAIGDLAIEEDPRSALADISAAPPNS